MPEGKNERNHALRVRCVILDFSRLARISAMRPNFRAPDINRVPPGRSLLAAVLDEFEGIIGRQMLVRPRDKRAFDPMIDRGRIPGQLRYLVSPGWIVDVSCRKGGFDLERLERTGPGGQGFLADDL